MSLLPADARWFYGAVGEGAGDCQLRPWSCIRQWCAMLCSGVPPRPQPTITERRLTANPEDASISSAAISPDGKYLAHTDKTGFYLKQVENGETHPVPLPKGFEPLAESWFPDSLHMVVSWGEDSQVLPTIWEISVLGRTPRKLADAGLFPLVSPDGSAIAYLSGDSGLLMRLYFWRTTTPIPSPPECVSRWRWSTRRNRPVNMTTVTRVS